MAATNKPGSAIEPQRQSLGTEAARNLATTTKSPPQMQGITSRWLLKLLEWVQVSAGVFRVNRRTSYELGDGRVSFTSVGTSVQVIPGELCELPILRGYDDPEVLEQLASRFVQREFQPGDLIVEMDRPADSICLVAFGKVERFERGKFGDAAVIDVLADGDHFSLDVILEAQDTWRFTARALTPCTVLMLEQRVFEEVLAQSPSLQKQIEKYKRLARRPHDKAGEAEIGMSAGHTGEPDLPNTYVDYDLEPREYELAVAQTVLRIHTRVADLYNQPMNQTEEQLRLTIEALRERQEHEMINNREIGLLYNADLKQRLHSRSGAPSPNNLDDLLGLVWKDPGFFLAHPRTIAAFGHECSRRGVYPTPVELNGHKVPAWRGVPIFPCSKIPITDQHTSSILLIRTGMEKQGVIGLHQTGIPDEYQPGLSVRFMGINEKAIISYLVSAYYSVAVLVPDALAIMENVQIGRAHRQTRP